MKTEKEQIRLYCNCEQCGNYFDVTGRKRSRFCDKRCRDRYYYSVKVPLVDNGDDIKLGKGRPRKEGVGIRAMQKRRKKLGVNRPVGRPRLREYDMDKIVGEVLGGSSVSEVCGRYGISRSIYYAYVKVKD